MAVNLFELVDKLFRGLVFFLYNIVETAWTALRHPFDGPLRLHRYNLDENRLQMAGLTFVFLIFFLFHTVLLSGGAEGATDLTGVFRRLAQSAAAGPSLDPDFLWPAIPAALLSTVILDAVFRLRLWFGGVSLEERQERVAGAEFALAWPFLLFAISLFALVMLGDAIRAAAWVNWTWQLSLVLAMAATFPALLILEAAVPPGDGSKWTVFRRYLPKTGLTGGLFFTALASGLLLGVYFNAEKARASELAAVATVDTLRCVGAPDGAIAVDALVALKKGHRAIEPRDFELLVGAPDSGEEGLAAAEPIAPQAESPGAADVLLVTEDQPQLVRLRAAAPPAGKGSRACRVRGLLSGITPTGPIRFVREASAPPRPASPSPPNPK